MGAITAVDADVLADTDTISDALNLIKSATANKVDYSIVTEQDVVPQSVTDFVTGFRLEFVDHATLQAQGAAPLFAIRPIGDFARCGRSGSRRRGSGR